MALIENHMVEDAYEDLPEVDEDRAYEESRQQGIDLDLLAIASKYDPRILAKLCPAK